MLPCPAGVNRLDQRRAKLNGAGGGGGSEEGERKRKCPGLVGVVLGRRGEGEAEEGEGEGRRRRRRVVLEGKK